MTKRYSIVSAFVLITLSVACTPTRVSSRVSLPSPTEWHHAPALQKDASTVNLRQWWKGFRDPILDDLVSHALLANHDLKISVNRVREANALVTVAESLLYPSIDLFASGGRDKRIDRVVGVPGKQGIELITPTANAVSGGLAARWEIDVFGAKHLEAEGIAAQADGAEEARHAVQVGLLAQVATNYFELRGIQARIDILMSVIALHKEKLRTLQAFYGAGLANLTDVSRQETLLHGTEGTLPVLNAAQATLIHRLGVLLGESPEKLENRLALRTTQPAAMPAIPKLLPSSLLLQRPDLRHAQTEVNAAAANLGAARADLLPKFVLSASGGLGALAVGGFPSLAESVYALGSGLTAPIFNAGRIRAQITAADARLAQVATRYEKIFLLALEDVENAFVTYTSSEQHREQLSQAKTAAEQTYQFSDALYHRGASDYLSVLDTRRSKLAISEAHVKAEAAVRVALVSLYRAFGDGWDDKPSVSQNNVGNSSGIPVLSKQ